MDIGMLTLNEYHQLAKESAISPNKSIVSSTLGVALNSSRDAVGRLLRLKPGELAEIARDPKGSKYLQENFSKSADLRARIFTSILGSGSLIALAKDSFGNFVVQKMITEPMPEVYMRDLHNVIQAHIIDLSRNRFACRVIQQLVRTAPAERVRLVLDAYVGIEVQIAIDQNANHIIQRVFEYHSPTVYEKFVQAFVVSKTSIKEVIEDKYGCRVVQVCLENLVNYCTRADTSTLDKKAAYGLLHILIQPILLDAISFSENEFANYIVQYVLCTKFMNLQRNYIIKNCILHNILWLSQSKFASHVVEQALIHADKQSRSAMFSEILEGYEPDARGRDALDILLFDQFGNYVVQRLLNIAIDEYKSGGNPKWLEKIARHVLCNAKQLERYSSGKKILDLLSSTFSPAALLKFFTNNNNGFLY